MRRSTNVFALLALVLCLATLVLWARSFLPANLHVGVSDGRLILLFTDPALTRHWQRQGGGNSGLAAIYAAEQWEKVRSGRHIQPDVLVYKPGGTVPTSGNTPPSVTTFAGFASATESRTGDYQYRLLAVPLLYLAGLLAVPPAAWLVAAFRRRRRTRAGHCAGCGYDLRASPGRCPECGADAVVPA